MASNWDRDLPHLTLADVRIHAGSLTEAWKNVATGRLVRSVLVASDRPIEQRPFTYEPGPCTVRDFLAALAHTYELTLIQDELTGVNWLHPREIAYQNLLGGAVRIDRDQLGLPMQSGILEPLVSSGTGISAKEWGTIFRNTFDYAVDVPAGTYTVRDILNRCCRANPTKSFFVRAGPDTAFVTAVNLVSDERRSAPEGALRWWDAEVGRERGKGEPAAREVMAMLAHPDPRRRAAARGYLEAILWNFELDERLERAAPVEETLWTAIGLLSVLVRTEEATHQASIELFERMERGGVLAKSAPGLALVTALEILRLTRSARALEVVSGRSLPAEELAGVVSDACRIAASSSDVRRALQTKSAEALLQSMPPLATVVRTGGRLELSLLSTP